MCENENLAYKNREILTGRIRGKFLEKGNARGGGHHWPTVKVDLIRYLADSLSNNEIFARTCGDQNGQWQPFEERTPAVKIVKETEIREYSPKGVRIL